MTKYTWIYFMTRGADRQHYLAVDTKTGKARTVCGYWEGTVDIGPMDDGYPRADVACGNCARVVVARHRERLDAAGYSGVEDEVR